MPPTDGGSREREGTVVKLARSLRRWAQALRRDILALWIAARDKRTPWYAKLVAAAVAAYALSPIDLIPDFIPVLGYLDDLLIVPLGIWVAVRLIPEHLMGKFRLEADRRAERPTSYAGLTAVILIWIALAFGAWLLLRRL